MTKMKDVDTKLAEYAELTKLVSGLMKILNTEEESDSGHRFHPTTISSCRALDSARLVEIFHGINQILENQDKP